MNANKNIKKSILEMMHYSKSSHVGSCLSVADILYVLYFRIMNTDPHHPEHTNRDKVILSKAHASAALYATLAERGFFPKSYLSRYYLDGGLLPGHLDRLALPGIEASGGSLGHGLSLGVGMALANRLSQNPGRVYVILGDGECNEGSVWEAVMLASTLGLSNLTAIVDYNGLQGFGRTNEVLNQTNLCKRWEAFGWAASNVDGHNLEELTAALAPLHSLTVPQGPTHQKRPRVVIAKTIKGKGVSFMENKLEWHYKSPNSEELKQAIEEVESIS